MIGNHNRANTPHTLDMSEHKDIKREGSPIRVNLNDSLHHSSLAGDIDSENPKKKSID